MKPEDEIRLARNPKFKEAEPAWVTGASPQVVASRRPRTSDVRFASVLGFRIPDFRSGFRTSRPTLALLACFAVVPLALAQPSLPRIGYVYPAGGRQGTTLQATLGGQFLNGATSVFVSGGGVQAAVVDYTKPLTPQQFRMLREQLQALLDKRVAGARDGRKGTGPGESPPMTNRTWTAQDEQTLAEIRKKLANPPNRQGNPAIAENVILQVRLTPDAEPGERELRVQTPSGLSNPLVFHVGRLPEFSKRPATSNAPPQLGDGKRAGREARGATPATDLNITLPCVVNGQILPGGVDRLRFKARQGTRLVVAVRARELIPYLPDAGPGWFQASLALSDGKGNELAHADHFRFHPDPVLYQELPRDGDYVVAIRDSLFRGREDFVYRVTLGELPFATDLFPLGGSVGAPTALELTGWNLPSTRMTHDSQNRAPGIYRLLACPDDRMSHPLPFALDTLPECLDREPNNLPVEAQPLTLPVIVNGRIDRTGDWDVFRFEGRAGDEIVAEVNARRLDSPLDSVLKLTDASGRPLALNDDHEDRGAGLDTHYADSYVRTLLPADGVYCIHLGDTQRQGGPEHAYRLRLGPPQPDFALRVVPSTLNVRGGGSVPLSVYALRKDGFTNEIALILQDAPPGFVLSGARVPAGQDQVRITLTAPALPQEEPASLRLEGRAVIQGRAVAHPAVPSEDMMQAFSYRHLVSAKELRVAIAGRGMPRAALKILGEGPVRIPVGGTARVRVSAPSRAFADRFQLELSEPPEGVTLQEVSPVREGAELVLSCDAAKAKAGLKGNLIVRVFAGKAAAASSKAKAPANPRRPSLGTLPAIPFEITPP